MCLHPSYICDGIYHCPRRDDEILCDNATCPEQCTCHGLAFTCWQPFPVYEYLTLRYLHAARSNMTLGQIADNTMLVYLNLADCGIVSVGNVSLPNLKTLDLRDNKLSVIPYTFLYASPNLRYLSISNNQLSVGMSYSSIPHRIYGTIQSLDFSQNPLRQLNIRFVKLFPDVRVLNFSGCGIASVSGEGFRSLRKLRTLDMKGCPLSTIDKHILQGLHQLQTVYADNFRLCCTAELIDNFHMKKCHAPKDEVSSCANLLHSDLYRVTLATFCILNIFGNSLCFLFRVLSFKRSFQAFSVFVLHLCMSDFLMGVYLAMIGITDWRHRDRYVWEDKAWTNSAGCRLAGFFALLSCEVSAFLICLITIDRFLAVRFPLSFVHFSGFHAQLASCVSWTIGLVLAMVPLLPSVAHWRFYSQTGICVPLPITTTHFSGHKYSFAVIIILNFALFLVVVGGQAAIYMSIRANTLTGPRSCQISQGMDIARRLFTVAVTDFLCWFPIGCLGLLASQGIAISGELNVAMAILVMPLNSAINPFLYTLNVILEKRQRRKEEQLLLKISLQQPKTPQ